MMAPRTRAGFVLVTVLWVIVAGAAFVTDVGLEVAVDMRAAEHRVGAERAYWRARGCSTRVRVEVERQLALASDELARARVWDELASRLERRDVAFRGCVIEFEAAGTRVPLNVASEPQLRRLATLVGLGGTAELTAATISGRRMARRFIDARELRTILSSEMDALALEQFVTADSGLIALNHASREALLAASGLPAEAVERLIRRRSIGIAVTSHRQLEDGISLQAAEMVRANMPAITALSTLTPDWWTVRTLVPGAPGYSPFRMEERLVRTDRGTAVLEVRLP